MQIPTRRSATGANKEITDLSAEYAGRDNLAFFAGAVGAMRAKKGRHTVYVGFVGSRDLPGVALRQAQAILRWDARPSLWSHTFLLPAGEAVDIARIGEAPIFHVPLDTRTAEFPEPSRNAVPRDARLSLYANPRRDANVALIALALKKEQAEKIRERCDDPNLDRLRYNFWDCLGIWQSYFWSFGLRGNPLREGAPIPAASFIEYCFEALQLDITPGASERNSAPEHLWNAAKFWSQAYAERGHAITGCFALRDKGCSLISADDDLTAPVETLRSGVPTAKRQPPPRPRGGKS